MKQEITRGESPYDRYIFVQFFLSLRNGRNKAEEMQNRQDIMSLVKSLRRRYRFSMRRILLEATGLLIALEAITVINHPIVSAQRKHHRQEVSFPPPHLSEVPPGENSLQPYDYGHDLYEAMLAAIDAAQESIYLETYIWKDDAIGQ